MSTREQVLASLLAESGTVSGERIAERLGISRAAVGKHVRSLQSEGCGIEVVKGSGYQLTSLPDECVPCGVLPRLKSDFWSSVEGGRVTGSTNEDARRLAAKGAPEGTAVVAAEQTSGRGRLGRSWSSPPGGAYMTGILRPEVGVADVSSLALAVAVGVAGGLQSLGADVGLEWPNDVMLNAEKLAGILLEMSTEAERVGWVIAGVGINVVRPKSSYEGAAYLSDSVPEATPATVCAAVLDALGESYRRWHAEGFRSLRDRYREMDFLAGREVEVRRPDGSAIVRGTASGVDDLGRLLVRDANGTVPVSSGEATLKS